MDTSKSFVFYNRLSIISHPVPYTPSHWKNSVEQRNNNSTDPFLACVQSSEVLLGIAETREVKISFIHFPLQKLNCGITISLMQVVLSLQGRLIYSDFRCVT